MDGVAPQGAAPFCRPGREWWAVDGSTSSCPAAATLEPARPLVPARPEVWCPAGMPAPRHPDGRAFHVKRTRVVATDWGDRVLTGRRACPPCHSRSWRIGLGARSASPPGPWRTGRLVDIRQMSSLREHAAEKHRRLTSRGDRAAKSAYLVQAGARIRSDCAPRVAPGPLLAQQYNSEPLCAMRPCVTLRKRQPHGVRGQIGRHGRWIRRTGIRGRRDQGGALADPRPGEAAGATSRVLSGKRSRAA